ncbi:hypothetical protein H6F46_13120 [Limnothrix sp. FACHB-1083]|uniref:hypothetical protein n=1 Tax=unclassified Limnothrix TaxID=2632864 RepID=UPI001680144B|nr:MULTISPECIES: hypothetical protein [unclassified Limnothrix]MBD2161634.1 hypothetical protein [Limnothrix sp. FACHB-1083]MBD2192347.1 hypothetical protein [Limnothrix sp. FACHB-1088]
MTEDYASAFLERAQDQAVLAKADRRIAAMHMGGIVIECRLKSLIFRGFPSAMHVWKTDDHDPGHNITNPGHHLLNTLKCCPKLYTKAKKSRDVLRWLATVQDPCGDFISLRYACHEVSDEDYSRWLTAYRNLKGWIQKNYHS